MLKTYPDTEQMTKALQAYDWQDWFLRKRREEANSTLKEIIRHSVAGNTFRAFHKLRVRPSEVFRHWAYEAIASGSLRDLIGLRTQKSFDAWLQGLSRAFQEAWRAKTGRRIPFGPGRKLPNLLMKRLCLSREIPQPVVDGLVWFLHVPLDNYSLAVIRFCVSSFPNAARIGNIPRSATMSFVADEKMYKAIQEGIRVLAKRASVPPIALDLLAWNDAHPGKD